MQVMNESNLQSRAEPQGPAGRGQSPGPCAAMAATAQYVWEVKVTRRTSELWAEDYREIDLHCDNGIVRYTIRA